MTVALLSMALAWAIVWAAREATGQARYEAGHVRLGLRAYGQRRRAEVRRRFERLRAGGPRDPGWWLWAGATAAGKIARGGIYTVRASARVGGAAARGARAGWAEGKRRHAERRTSSTDDPNSRSDERPAQTLTRHTADVGGTGAADPARLVPPRSESKQVDAGEEDERDQTTGGTTSPDIDHGVDTGRTGVTTTHDGETIGLQGALEYTAAMATSCQDGVTSAEQSVAHMQAGEVGGDTIGHLAQGQELLGQAAEAFESAHEELEKHVAVKDAYDANPDAGSKEFLTAD